MQIRSTTAAVLFPKEFLATFLLTRKRDIVDGRAKVLTHAPSQVVELMHTTTYLTRREVSAGAVYLAICEGLFVDAAIAKRINRGVTSVRSYARKLIAKDMIVVRMCGPKNTKFAYFPKEQR